MENVAESSSGSCTEAVNAGHAGHAEHAELQHSECKTIPAGIFSPELGTLEAVTKYLRENRGMRLSRIALLLNRDARTIWGAYRSSAAKRPEPFAGLPAQQSPNTHLEVEVPLEIFSNRSFGMLESAVLYLREDLSMPFTRIAALMRRDYSTVWTACARAKIKKRRQQWTGSNLGNLGNMANPIS